MAEIPATQTVLILHAAKQPYETAEGYQVPEIQNEQEVLVKTEHIGLNPIDWKAPDFNFAIPTLPYISGRELVGRVVRRPQPSSTTAATASQTQSQSRLREGDQVLVISTDYRDLRKAAYQEYVVTSDFNAARIPPNVSPRAGATLGVAFVAAALSLAVCMGVDFSHVLDGPDLLTILRSVPPESLPQDIRAECLSGIGNHERATAGDWVVIWGGSSTSANLAVQLARLAGLKVVTVVDKLRHGLRLSNHTVLRPDLLVDSHDPARAIDIIRANVGKDLRFALDTSGRESAGWLLRALTPSQDANAPPSPPDTPRNSAPTVKHLIGLTGLPKEQAPEAVAYHTVPIKVFHEVPAVGEALVTWLERLLESGLVSPPEVLGVEEGFEGINRGLDRMRKGEIRGGRMVVSLAPEGTAAAQEDVTREASVPPALVDSPMADGVAEEEPQPSETSQASSPEFTAQKLADTGLRRGSATLWQAGPAGDAVPRSFPDEQNDDSSNAAPRRNSLWQPNRVSRSTYDFSTRLLRKRCMHIDSTSRLSLLLLSLFSPSPRSLPPTLSLKCITSLYLSPFGKSLDDKPTAMWVRELFCEVCDTLKRLIVDMPFGTLSGYDDHLDVRPTLTDGFQRLSKLEELICLRDYPALTFMQQTFTVNCWSLWPNLRRVVLFNAPMSSHWLWYDIANTAQLEQVVLARPLVPPRINVKDDYYHMLNSYDHLTPRKIKIVLADVESDLPEIETTRWDEYDPEGMLAIEKYDIPTSFYGDENATDLCCDWVKMAALNGSIWDWKSHPVDSPPANAVQ
ncbi:alcohol dehydrogenase GroES-like domain-containing protein [Colletotrichum scovillei]|nr:alcohol dehydrogenase GroES-like domain-containing protein [Colletotrichum scovillei]